MKVFAIVAAVLLHQQVLAGQGESENQISKSTNEFANRLYQVLSTTPGNVVVSPLSAHLLLTLVLQGAGGNTASQLAQHLALSGTNFETKQGYQALLQAVQDESLKIATRLFPANDVQLNDKFETVARNYFSSGVEKLDFNNPESAATSMNEFVKEKTNNKIRDIISPDQLDRQVRLVLINALHFQASWKHEFSETKYLNFRVNRTKIVNTKMMYVRNGFMMKTDLQLNATIVKLDYKVDGYSMVIVLPREEDGLQKVEGKLANMTLQTLMEGLEEDDVGIYLPEFSLEQTIAMVPLLKQMGIKDLFSPVADLTNITAGGEQLCVSEVVQKACINVHQKGTEAGASTAVTLNYISNHELFLADSPFHFYLIHDKTPEVVLFEGRLVDPTVSMAGQRSS